VAEFEAAPDAGEGGDDEEAPPPAYRTLPRRPGPPARSEADRRDEAYERDLEAVLAQEARNAGVVPGAAAPRPGPHPGPNHGPHFGPRPDRQPAPPPAPRPTAPAPEAAAPTIVMPPPLREAAPPPGPLPSPGRPAGLSLDLPVDAEARGRRSRFATGLAVALLIFLALLALYALRTQIAAALSGAAPALARYAAAVDALRLAIEGLWASLLGLAGQG
jgi:hypothetical protein